jgi:membrane-bound lytic murein transglycosylase D
MRRTIILLSVFAGACVRPAVPAVAPAPAPTPVETHEPAPTPPAPIVVQQATPRKVDTVSLDTAVVTRRATEMFGVRAAAPADATAAGPSWDIEVKDYESTERVDHYVRLFAGKAKERIASRLEEGTRYEAMIRARMREGGIPEDMYYLALIESGFDPNAYSRAAAVGMWQFMTSTARDVGLRVDWWVDERRDPFKSTIAAVRFLKGLNEQFGSMYLAAAAYNGGPVRIARGLKRYADDLEGTTGDDLFFALAEKDYLRNETREYVPQLIAAALIAKEPEKYGMTITPQPALTYDSVRVAPVTALSAVAKAAGVSVEAVRQLNPHVLRGVTPPKDSFWVRVPSGSSEIASAALADMPKSERVGLITTESKKGQSLASIANANGVSSRQLALYNPKLKKLKSGNLVPGQMLLIPTSSVAVAAVSVPDPEIERYGSATKGSSATTYLVKKGDNLSTIAKRYGTSTAALMTMNGLRKPLIFVGQSLVVKGAAAKAKTVAKARAGTSTKKAPARKSVASKKPLKKTTASAKAPSRGNPSKPSDRTRSRD